MDITTTTLDLVGCPQCAEQAEVVDRFVLESTDGPIEHVKIQCARRHWFTMTTEGLTSGRVPAARSTDRARVVRTGEEPTRWTRAPRSS